MLDYQPTYVQKLRRKRDCCLVKVMGGLGLLLVFLVGQTLIPLDRVGIHWGLGVLGAAGVVIAIINLVRRERFQEELQGISSYSGD